MDSTHRCARGVITLLLSIVLVPTLTHADEKSGLLQGVFSTCREINQASGVGAYLSKKVSDHAESGAKSVLSLLPGNADDVAEAGEHTYSLMDRAVRQIKHMIDTDSTDGEERFWNETKDEAGRMLYDALVPDLAKEGIEKGSELVDNANWLAERTEHALQWGGDTNDPLSSLDGYLREGRNDTPGNDGSSLSDWDQVLRDLGEAPTPAGNELKDLSDAAGSSMTSRDTYSAYEAMPNGGGTSFADSFQAASAEGFKQAVEKAEAVIESSLPTPNPSQPTRISGDAGEIKVWNYPGEKNTQSRVDIGADCDQSALLKKLYGFVRSLDLDPSLKEPCDWERNQIDISTRQLKVFEGCSLDGPLGAIAKPIQQLLEQTQKDLKTCLRKEKDRLRAEEERKRAECAKCSQYYLCPDYCGKR